MTSAQSVTATAPEEVRATLGAILRELRDRQGRTLTEVGTEAGISAAYLSEVERGRKDASTEVLVGVAYALGAELAEVYSELGRRLRPEREPVWPADPRRQLRMATSALDAEGLRAVAQFSAFLATTGPAAPRRRIGFIVRDGG